MFEPGQSGNPEGRRVEISEAFKTIRDICKLRSSKMVDILTAIAENEKERGMTRIAAASAVLDRAWGKATQGIEVTENKPMVDISRIPDEAVQAYHLVKQGKARIVLVEPECNTKPDV